MAELPPLDLEFTPAEQFELELLRRDLEAETDPDRLRAWALKAIQQSLTYRKAFRNLLLSR